MANNYENTIAESLYSFGEKVFFFGVFLAVNVFW